jgi:hypothetical protein
MNYADLALPIILLTIGGFLSLKVKRWLNIRTMRKRFDKGAQAEIDAVGLIESNGFKITEDQSEVDCSFKVDGEKTSYTLRADFLATKNGKKYVIEVKSGDSAPDPKYSETRRQLLEYDHVYRPDGLLLADMKEVELHTIEFDIDRPSHTWLDKLKAATLFLAIGVAIGFAWRSYLA